VGRRTEIQKESKIKQDGGLTQKGRSKNHEVNPREKNKPCMSSYQGGAERPNDSPGGQHSGRVKRGGSNINEGRAGEHNRTQIRNTMRKLRHRPAA